MEDQDFRNFNFRSVCLKVLLNAVLLSYHALESTHGARRTKQTKISNFDIADIAVHEVSRLVCSFLEQAQRAEVNVLRTSFRNFLA